MVLDLKGFLLPVKVQNVWTGPAPFSAHSQAISYVMCNFLGRAAFFLVQLMVSDVVRLKYLEYSLV